MDILNGLGEYLMPLRSVASTFARLDAQRVMLQDPVRVAAFRDAVNAVVHPGDVVVDIGTGTGILALIAAAAGARKVYAIEMTELAEIARELAEKNGFKDRITVMRGLSTDVELPERADVLISETLGHIGIDEGVVTTVADARRRLLKPGARIIPAGIDVLIAPTTDRGVIEREAQPWREPICGFDYTPLSHHACRRTYLRRTLQSEWCALPRVGARVDLLTADEPPATLETRFTCLRAAECTGIASWFESDVAGGVRINSRATVSWIPVLFPLDPPMRLELVDEINVRISWRPMGDEVAWGWTVSTPRESRNGGRIEAFSDAV